MHPGCGARFSRNLPARAFDTPVVELVLAVSGESATALTGTTQASRYRKRADLIEFWLFTVWLFTVPSPLCSVQKCLTVYIVSNSV